MSVMSSSTFFEDIISIYKPKSSINLDSFEKNTTICN